MPLQLNPTTLSGLRLIAHSLASPRPDTAPAMAARMVAIQAQEKSAALLATRARAGGVTEATVNGALEEFHSLVRTWCLRGTLHLLHAADVRWMLRLVAPRVLRNSRRRYRQLELEDETLDRATELLCAALETRGALTRPELGEHLETHGISAKGQRLPHLLRRAALLGHICHGAARDDGTDTYVLLTGWLGPEPQEPEDGWAMLAERYLHAYGPASIDDFASWSGALKKDARRAFAAVNDRLIEAQAQGETMWMPETHVPLLQLPPDHLLPAMRLLPGYDPLLLGYRSRDWLVDAAFAREIHPGGGLIRPAVLIDGAAAGTWKIDRRRTPQEVIVRPFTALDDRYRLLLEAEVADLERFYGRPMALRLETS